MKRNKSLRQDAPDCVCAWRQSVGQQNEVVFGNDSCCISGSVPQTTIGLPYKLVIALWQIDSLPLLMGRRLDLSRITIAVHWMSQSGLHCTRIFLSMSINGWRLFKSPGTWHLDNQLSAHLSGNLILNKESLVFFHQQLFQCSQNTVFLTKTLLKPVL